MALFSFMAADITAITTAPLRGLDISYPAILNFSNYFGPVLGLIVLLATARRWPRVSPFLVVGICSSTLWLIPALASSRLATIRVKRPLDFTETAAMETRLGFKVFEQGSIDGTTLSVAPSNESAARAYLKSVGLTNS